MFCFKCGKQIRDDALFCQYCGTQQDSASTKKAVNQPNENSLSSKNGELDRDALKIYLGDVLSLESIKANYERRIGELDWDLSRLNNSYYKRYVLRKDCGEAKCAHFFYDGQLYIAFFKPEVSYGLYYHSGLNSKEYNWVCIHKDSDIAWLKKTREWGHYDDIMGFCLDKWEQRADARDAFFKAYAEFKEEAPLIYHSNVANNNELSSNWQQKVNGMRTELDSVNRLLKQAYDINIIPSQFRHNIYAIYYLHDFVTTSRESLTTALLHFDLNEIKAKLDKIIAQQEEIIIQNAAMMAQNDQLIKQNQQQLEYLSRVESNTSQAAQYAQIAANNAETCAWISMANYIEAH